MPSSSSLAAIACALASLASTAFAQMPVTANFIDSETASWTETQKSSFNAAIAYFSSIFIPTYAGQQWTINANIELIQEGIANAGPVSIHSFGTGNFYYAVTQYNALMGSTVVSGPVIEMNFSSAVNWNYSSTPTHAAPVQDSFYTTTIHEALHGLGFLSSLTADGTYEEDKVMLFDTYLALIDNGVTTSLIEMSPTERATAFTSGKIFWTGQHAVEAFGSPIPMYAPSEPESGSSMSHIGFMPQLADGLIMYPNALGDRPESYTFSAAELGMLKDLGYSVIPEPGTYLLFLLGGVLMLMRFRRSSSLRD